MADPFIGEVRMVGFNFAPRGWAQCDGQLLPINQNQSLYAILGTTYGGDGRTTFALPDLRGRAPVHVGDDLKLGQAGGAETHTLTTAEMAGHSHILKASTAEGDSLVPVAPDGTGHVLAVASGSTPYRSPTNLVAMDAATSQFVGGSQAHENMQPYLSINFIIALEGLFPSRS